VEIQDLREAYALPDINGCGVGVMGWFAKQLIALFRGLGLPSATTHGKVIMAVLREEFKQVNLCYSAWPLPQLALGPSSA
jgi:hypothetical protein